MEHLYRKTVKKIAEIRGPDCRGFGDSTLAEGEETAQTCANA